jgi:tetratricopeptide (TPR) repeat protein
VSAHRGVCYEDSGMSATSKRLEFFLRQTTAEGPAKDDAFAWYGLAMEYRALLRQDDALAVFEKLRSRSPHYVAMYLMCGQMLEQMGRVDDARSWFNAGIEAARRTGDGHALSELEAALAGLG